MKLQANPRWAISPEESAIIILFEERQKVYHHNQQPPKSPSLSTPHWWKRSMSTK